MEFKEYDAQTEQTAVYPGQGTMFGLLYVAAGVGGEGGEFLDKAKKAVRDIQRDPHAVTTDLPEEKRQAMLSELGDELWYVSAAARELGYTLDDVAATNIEKITGRKERGTLHGEGDNR